jgi:hypothetical protein
MFNVLKITLLGSVPSSCNSLFCDLKMFILYAEVPHKIPNS